MHILLTLSKAKSDNNEPVSDARSSDAFFVTIWKLLDEGSL